MPIFRNFDMTIDKSYELNRSFFITTIGTNPSKFPPGSDN